MTVCSPVRTMAFLLGLAAAPAVLAADGQPESSSGVSGQAPAGQMDQSMERFLKERQGFMIRMHELMHRIAETRDPEEKLRLMAQQRHLMAKNMQRMQEMRMKHKDLDMQKGMKGMQGEGNMGPGKPMEPMPPHSSGSQGGMTQMQ